MIKKTEEKFKEVTEAFDTLSNPNKRAAYDGRTQRQQHHHRSSYGQSPAFHSIFEQFFGGSPDKGKNLKVRVEIELKDVFTGLKVPLVIQKTQPCKVCEGRGYTGWEACTRCSGSGKAFYKQSPFNVFVSCSSCRGTGRSGTIKCEGCSGAGVCPAGEETVQLEIPAGIEAGMQIRLPGYGEPGRQDALPGNLYVLIIVKPHPLFVRDKDDLVMEVPVSYTQLVLGDTIKLTTLDSKKVTCTIPKGCQNGAKIVIKNLGLPKINSKKRGNLIITPSLEIPSDPSYVDLLQQLAKLEKNNPTKKQQEFASKFI